MPATPLHYLLAYGVERASRGRLNLPALAVGSVIPDVEVPVLFALGIAGPHHRLFLHSLFGGLVVGTLVSVALTIWLYPRIVPYLVPVDPAELQRRCRPSINVLASGLLGVLTHVGVDVTHHEYNPLWYPFSGATVNVFLLFNDVWLAQIVVHSVFLATGALVLYRETRRWPTFWRRMLLASVPVPAAPSP